jgi:hypothetical protein
MYTYIQNLKALSCKPDRKEILIRLFFTHIFSVVKINQTFLSMVMFILNEELQENIYIKTQQIV